MAEHEMLQVRRRARLRNGCRLLLLSLSTLFLVYGIICLVGGAHFLLAFARSWEADLSIAAMGYVICYTTAAPYVFQCTACGKSLSSQMVWVCGFCDDQNVPSPNVFAFYQKCWNPNCRMQSKAFRCPHCHAVIFLDKDHDERHAAIVSKLVASDELPSRPQRTPEAWEKEIDEGAKKLDNFSQQMTFIQRKEGERIAKIDADASLDENQRKTQREYIRRYLHTIV
jgi:hypothetical protein